MTTQYPAFFMGWENPWRRILGFPRRQAAEQELNAPNYASLTAMDREILLEIFEGMGRDQQGQKSALSHGRDQLRDAAASAQEQKEKNAKLYQSMGLLLGAAAVVLLV